MQDSDSKHTEDLYIAFSLRKIKEKSKKLSSELDDLKTVDNGD